MFIILYCIGFTASVMSILYFHDEFKKDSNLILSDAADALPGVAGLALVPVINIAGAALMFYLVRKHKEGK